MAGRTVLKHTRVYVDGYDLSGYSRSVGPLMWQFDEADLTCIPDAVKGALPNQATLSIGSLNAVFDNTATSSLHVIAGTPGALRNIMVAVGSRAAPAQGDPAYCCQLEQKDYMLDPNSGAVYANIAFDKSSTASTSLLYSKPWGWLLHANGAETAVNTAVGIDSETGAATAFGGYMMYQVFAGNGTATIKVQDAATNTNPSFADLTGATSGSIDCSTPKYGVVALGRTATVRQYLRWQIVLGTATTVTFALAFVRATY